MSFGILESILSVFLIALFVAAIFRHLRLSVILGYLIVGILVGPYGLKLIPDSTYIKELAEFGIVFLMFTVGLEFSAPKLLSLKSSVFIVGGFQVLFSIIITALVGMALGMTSISAMIVGGVVAMSSTAIVVKQLNDQLELHTSFGRNAIGILLFQDLAVIPFIILISGLAKHGQQSLSLILFIALLKGILAIFLIYLIGRWLLRPLFRMISRTRAIELFTLAVLVVTLMSAWLTHALGLSFALGAFLAGIMLSETEFRHQIEVEIRPFRDILLGLFFITIGMLANISTWYQTWIWILLLLCAITIGKMLLIFILCRICHNNPSTSLRTGLVLAQGGEFGFAILTLALGQDIIPSDYGQVILAALLISIIIAPILIYYHDKIVALVYSKETKHNLVSMQQQITATASKLHQHVILCGYGRVGQHIARLLDRIEIPYIGLDIDAELVQRASLGGDNVIFGDSTHPAILKAAGVDHARVLVICVAELRSAIKILSIVKQTHPSLPTLVRCRDDIELRKLKALGATHVIAELFEESITLSHHLMKIIKMPANKIAGLIDEVRSKDYDLLNRVFSGSYADSHTDELIINKELRPILITPEAYAVNRRLKEFHFQAINIEVIAIRRGSEKHIKPNPDTILHPHDILILFGDLTDLEKAEEVLLAGT